MDVVGACSEWASGLFLAAEQSIGCGQGAWIGRVYNVDFIGACSKSASGLSLAAGQSIGWGREAWIGRVYNVDFIGACSKSASGLSLAAEQSIGWGQEAWMERVYKVDVVGACSAWASGLFLAAEQKLQCHKFTSGDNKFASAAIHVVCGLAQPSYVTGHIFRRTSAMKSTDVSRYLGLTSVVFFCPRHGG